MKYLIESKQGVFMGVYDGQSRAEALHNMHIDAGADPASARLEDWYFHDVIEVIHARRGTLYVLEGGGVYLAPVGPVDGAGGGRLYKSFPEAMKSLGYVEHNGRLIDIEAARVLMDDELASQIHGLAETEQVFFDTYCREHLKKYGQPFVFG